MKLFEKLIAPIGVHEFEEKFWRKSPVHLSKEFDTDFILSVEDINNYLGNISLTYPHIRMIGDGTELDIKNYSLEYHESFNFLDKEALFNLFIKGNTIVIQAAQLYFQNLNSFLKQLEGELGFEISANVYITPSNSKGFNPHFDTHEVLVLQISGTKSWNLYDIPVQAPIKTWRITQKERDRYLQTEPTHRLTISEGDLLYIPKGVVHDAFTTGDLSIHITFGMHPVTRLQVLKMALDKAEQHSYFRECYEGLAQKPNESSAKNLIAKFSLLMPPVNCSFLSGEYKKYHKNTLNYFASLFQIDNLKAIEDLQYLDLVITSDSDQEQLTALEAYVKNNLSNYKALLEAFDSFDKIKEQLKSLINKGMITVNLKEMEPSVTI